MTMGPYRTPATVEEVIAGPPAPSRFRIALASGWLVAVWTGLYVGGIWHDWMLFAANVVTVVVVSLASLLAVATLVGAARACRVVGPRSASATIDRVCEAYETVRKEWLDTVKEANTVRRVEADNEHLRDRLRSVTKKLQDALDAQGDRPRDKPGRTHEMRWEQPSRRSSKSIDSARPDVLPRRPACSGTRRGSRP